MTKQENFKGLPIFNLIIDEFNQEDGVSVMSIVESPAVEKDFIKLSKTFQKLSFNEEKKIVTGVALRANYPILREGFYIKFDRDTISKVAIKFLKENKGSSVNINHNEDTDNIFLIESYILDENHTNKLFSDIELGSWIVSYKVDNEEIWNKIKLGELNGFSVEITGIKKNPEDIELEEIYNILKNIG